MSSEGDVLSIVLWSMAEKGELNAQVLSGELDEDSRPLLARTAAESLNQARSVCKLLQAGTRGQVVSSRVDTNPPQAVTVQFSSVSGTQTDLQIRTQLTELAAAKIAIDYFQQTSHDLKKRETETQSSNSDASLFRRIGSWSRQSMARKKGIVAMVILTICILICPWNHAIKARVVCEPATRRFVSAPFDAKVERSLVKPGDQVQQGQLLVQLDGSDLRSEIASLSAKYDQAVQRSSAALSSIDATKVAMERLEIQHLASEIQLLKSQQSRLEIRAPIDGVVVSGDLEQASGATVAVGQTIFEIAPLEKMVAEIAIPESEISFVQPDQSVTVWFDALPGEPRTAKILRVHPRSEILNNESVFVSEVAFSNEDGVLRPGMKGQAAVQAGYRSIGWLWLSKPYHAVRMLIGF